MTSVSDIRSHMRAAAAKKLMPLDLDIELTTKCQLACQHCYNFDRQESSNTHDELTYEKVSSILREAYELGVFSIMFTGGEATLHPQAIELVRLAKSLNFEVIFRSHGALSEKRLGNLLNAGIDKLDVSVYGHEATHDALTTVKGSHAATMRSLDRCRELDLRTEVSMVVTSLNFHEVPSVFEFFENRGESLGVSHVLAERHTGETLDRSLRLTPDEWEAYYRLLPDELRPKPQQSKGFKCGCATTGFAVAANGDVYPCISVPWKAGSVFEQSLRDIWEFSPVFLEIRGLTRRDYKACGECPIQSQCYRHPSGVYTETGDYTGSSESMCTQAQAFERAYQSELSQQIKVQRA